MEKGIQQNQTLSFEEATALINEKPEFPEGAEKLVGEKNLKRIRSLAFNKDLTELEVLRLCGNMTEEELDQYIILVDEIRKLRGTVFKIAQEIAGYVLEKFQKETGVEEVKQDESAPSSKVAKTTFEKIKRVFTQDVSTLFGKRGEAQVSEKTQPSEKPAQPLESLIKVIYNIENVIFSQAAGANTVRNALLKSLANSVHSVLVYILLQKINCKRRRHLYSDGHKRRISETIRVLDESQYEEYGEPFQGAFSQKAAYNAFDVFYPSSPERSEKFFSMLFETDNLAKKQPLNKRSLEKLEAETDEIFSQINNLSCLRTIGFAKRKFGETEISIYENEDESSEDILPINRAFSICRARIVIDPSLPVKKHYLRDDDVIMQCFSKGSIEVGINRGTGEITLRDTILPLYIFLGMEAYLRLKKIIYKFVLGHLENRPNDIEDKLVSTQIKKITEETAETADRTVPIRAEGKQRKIVSKSLPRKTASQEENEQTSPAETQQPQESPDDNNFMYLQQLRGIQGNRICRTAETLLGKPIRISGSHHVFKSRNEGTCVIALHGSDLVGIGMLKNFLDRAGISPREFAGHL